MTTDITELAKGLKAAANKAGADDWQAKKISGDFYVIRKGSYSSQCGYRTYEPIAEIDHKSTRDYVAIASPANILALVEALKKAQQYAKERDEENQDLMLTIGRFRVEREGLEAIRAAAEKLVRCKGRYHSEQNYRALAALFGVTTPDLPPLDSESRTVTVKLPPTIWYEHDDLSRDVPVLDKRLVKKMLREAGIKVEAE
ncbi:ead/Ea22-like family protein [Klebsiella sp. 2680]|uniref:ead/Ea22-like family protein n=1 Tax=Klebsiella sp. 2680 TaxID=2018037 RepID=UPI00115882CB|nr:ead/Ea22-like family protein [Klebsiella sp. 2680]